MQWNTTKFLTAQRFLSSRPLSSFLSGIVRRHVVQTGNSDGESVVDSDDDGEDSEEYSELDEEEEEGLSWDELEEEAKR